MFCCLLSTLSMPPRSSRARATVLSLHRPSSSSFSTASSSFYASRAAERWITASPLLPNLEADDENELQSPVRHVAPLMQIVMQDQSLQYTIGVNSSPINIFTQRHVPLN
jgi:hypothetical protein